MLASSTTNHEDLLKVAAVVILGAVGMARPPLIADRVWRLVYWIAGAELLIWVFVDDRVLHLTLGVCVALLIAAAFVIEDLSEAGQSQGFIGQYLIRRRKRKEEEEARRKRHRDNVTRTRQVLAQGLDTALRILRWEINDKKLRGPAYIGRSHLKEPSELLKANVSEQTAAQLAKADAALARYNEIREKKHDLPKSEAEFQDPDAAWRLLSDEEIGVLEEAKAVVTAALSALVQEPPP